MRRRLQGYGHACRKYKKRVDIRRVTEGRSTRKTETQIEGYNRGRHENMEVRERTYNRWTESAAFD